MRNGRKVVLGTGESLLGPVLWEREADPPITGAPGKWWTAERQSEEAILAFEGSGQHNPARAKGPYFIDVHACKKGVWPVPENGLDQPGELAGSPAGSAGVTARAIRRADGLTPLHALQRVLYRCAKQDPARRFHALYDKLTRSDVMWQAWCDVAANRGAAGVDGITIESIASEGAESVRVFLGELADRIRSSRYRPAPLRRVYIPKPGRPGEHRPLSIPTVADRVVMTAAKLVLEPIFEAGFLPVSFGFRPKRSTHDALEVVRVEASRGREWVLDADVADCFGSLDHEAVMGQVAHRVSDRRMLTLVRAWLRVGVLDAGVVTNTVSGTPQGSRATRCRTL